VDLSSRRFSQWALEPSDVEGRSVIVQVKVAEGLLAYTGGRSAMVWYGVLAPCAAPQIADLLKTLSVRFHGQTLVWRFLVSDSAEDELAQLLQRFMVRFGSPPKGMVKAALADDPA